MEHLQQIDKVIPLKVLSDPRRLAILRLLMREPMTLSQLGRVLDAHPARVRHHLKQLEQAGFVQLTLTQVVRGFVEKYYQASAQAYLINLAIVPEKAGKRAVLAFGSHDMALDLLAEQLNEVTPSTELFSLPVGSLDGLIALRQGICQLAACHLLDEVSGEYNRDFVRHLFPGKSMALFTLTNRQQGLLVRPGNPRQIKGLPDLARQDVTFINRQSGSGTRLWLDHELGKVGLPSSEISGYDRELNTHVQVGRAIAGGSADAGIGLLAAARRYDLDFIPLFVEKFDLVIPAENIAGPDLQPLLDHLQSARLRKAIDSLGGYDTSHTGDELIENG